MIAWRIAASTPACRADDLSGAGAALTGGRWNPPGLPVLYCAASISLAYLETLVHLDLAGPMPRNRYRIEVIIPDAIWNARFTARFDPAFPADWNAHPGSAGSVDYGRRWLSAATHAVMVVPSVVIPEEDNILVNPHHRDRGKVLAVNHGRVDYDHRLFAGLR